MEAVEEAFSCFLVHKPDQENERLASYQKKLSTIMTTLSAEVQESAIRQYLTLTAVLTNRYKMKQLLTLLENLVNTNVLQARYVNKLFINELYNNNYIMAWSAHTSYKHINIDGLIT